MKNTKLQIIYSDFLRKCKNTEQKELLRDFYYAIQDEILENN